MPQFYYSSHIIAINLHLKKQKAIILRPNFGGNGEINLRREKRSETQ